VAYPFMPIKIKNIRKAYGTIEDSNPSENSAKTNGKFESEKIKKVSETNPHPQKKTNPHCRVQNHY
jgi:hypothetical protein